MKNLSFLIKLQKEGKLKIVEPSEEIKESYIEKSESNLVSAKILFDNNKLEESVSLTYYSMYNLVTALFFKIGIKCENHIASIILIKKVFNIDNSPILLVKKERIDKQYYTDFHISKQDVLENIQITEKFNKNLIDFISKLTNQDLKKYREKFKFVIIKAKY